MIFVTVGHELPFDRLVRDVDDWAGRMARTDVFAQVGKSSYEATHIETREFLDPQAFRRRMSEATGIVSHAGMGTIITALELGKPLLVMPRLAKYRETRSDHQVSTARRFADAGRILTAFSREELFDQLDRLENRTISDSSPVGVSETLLVRLRSFIGGNETKERCSRNRPKR